MSRIPYHQNVYDLLDITPGECPDAARLIAEHEACYGPLPASVREWYLVPNIVPLDLPDDLDPSDGEGSIWHDYLPHDPGNQYRVRALDYVLGTIRGARPGTRPVSIPMLNTWGYYTWTWSFVLDGSDDPPVWIAADPLDRSADPPKLDASTFSEFLTKQFVEFYRNNLYPMFVNRPSGAPSVHANGLWLRTPAEPLAVPVLDFLTEQFGEPVCTPRPGEVTTYLWCLEGGMIRVTAGHPAHTEPLSAWWVHAEAPERLTEFARLLLPWGTLATTLRADIGPARAGLQAVRGEWPN